MLKEAPHLGKYLFCALLLCAGCKSTPPPPPTFVSKNWQLTALHTAGGEKILPEDYGFNMRFEDGRISGKGACNYVGFYYQWRYADSLSVFGGDQTEMACEPELRMTWDDWFIAEMLKVRALYMPDSTHLELRCNDGGKVFFKQTTQDQ